MESARSTPSSGRPELNLVTVPEPQPCFTILSIFEFMFRIEFWSDSDWNELVAAAHPEAVRAHSGDGWFSVRRIE